ncbi:hypothetical protein A176_005727 [Myxococcus hansupus]|uniref:Uncharacterized protein n=1 Tax=Pseudomyxococcus hansupus TaxID=1297742 RepID=A0A0H4X5D2_9BACT|nr:hypothetical protein A176_005727 [Myxococcus hansupus]
MVHVWRQAPNVLEGGRKCNPRPVTHLGTEQAGPNSTYQRPGIQ